MAFFAKNFIEIGVKLRTETAYQQVCGMYQKSAKTTQTAENNSKIKVDVTSKKSDETEIGYIKHYAQLYW